MHPPDQRVVFRAVKLPLALLAGQLASVPDHQLTAGRLMDCPDLVVPWGFVDSWVAPSSATS